MKFQLRASTTMESAPLLTWAETQMKVGSKLYIFFVESSEKKPWKASTHWFSQSPHCWGWAPGCSLGPLWSLTAPLALFCCHQSPSSYHSCPYFQVCFPSLFQMWHWPTLSSFSEQLFFLVILCLSHFFVSFGTVVLGETKLKTFMLWHKLEFKLVTNILKWCLRWVVWILIPQHHHKPWLSRGMWLLPSSSLAHGTMA